MIPPPLDTAQQQQTALMRFKDWATDPRALVIDTETTGKQGGVWQIGAALAATSHPLLSFSGNVPEGTIWEKSALEMHGEDLLTTLSHCPPIQDPAVVKMFQRIFAGKRLLSYNADFEAEVMTRTFGMGAFPKPECVMTTYAVLAGRWSESRGEWKWVSLLEALALEGIEAVQNHNALMDSLLVSQLIHKVAQRAP